MNSFKSVRDISVFTDEVGKSESRKLKEWSFIGHCSGECSYNVLVEFDDASQVEFEGYAEGRYRPVLEVRDSEIIVLEHF